MTGHTTRFDPANRATEHTPADCGEESPRSCTRWKKQRPRERGRPRPHQPDDRPYDLFRSCKCCVRTFTGWGRARMPALLQRVRKSSGPGSAAVLGRINPTTDLIPVSFTQIRRPNIHRLGAAKNRRAPATRWENQRRSGARPSPAASTRHQILHPFHSRKSGARPFTGWGRARMPALPQRVGNRNGAGSAAVLGRINPTTDLIPVSFTQIRRPNIDRLGAAKNRRAPAARRKPQRRSGARPSPAASTRRPIVRPVSITQIRRLQQVHRLGGGINVPDNVPVTISLRCGNCVPVPISHSKNRGAPADVSTCHWLHQEHIVGI